MAKYNDEIKKDFYNMIANGETVINSCKILNISTPTYYEWYNNKEDFRDAIDDAKLIFKEQLSGVLKDTAREKLLGILNDGYVIVKTNKRKSIITHKIPVYDDENNILYYKVKSIETTENVDTTETNFGIPQWVFDKLMIGYDDIPALLRAGGSYSIEGMASNKETIGVLVG